MTTKKTMRFSVAALLAVALQMTARAIDFPANVPADAVYLTSSDSSSYYSLTTDYTKHHWSDGNSIQETDTEKNSTETLISRFGGDGSLDAFISTASKRTRTSGGFTVMCMTAERLPECLELFAKHGLAPSRLINVHATEDKNSFLSLLAGKKSAPGAGLRVLPPLILNETDREGNFVRTARHAAIYEEEHKDCFIS